MNSRSLQEHAVKSGEVTSHPDCMAFELQPECDAAAEFSAFHAPSVMTAETGGRHINLYLQIRVFLQVSLPAVTHDSAHG